MSISTRRVRRKGRLGRKNRRTRPVRAAKKIYWDGSDGEVFAETEAGSSAEMLISMYEATVYDKNKRRVARKKNNNRDALIKWMKDQLLELD